MAAWGCFFECQRGESASDQAVFREPPFVIDESFVMRLILGVTVDWPAFDRRSIPCHKDELLFFEN